MKVSLVISTYNWPQALRLCLGSALRQTLLPDEIVIADDGSEGETREMIADVARSASIPIRHVWHEDFDYRKTVIMNKAMHAAIGEYIVQTDGDMLLHPHFIEDHLSFAEEGFFIRGSRALVDAAHTQAYIREGTTVLPCREQFRSKNLFNAFRIPLLSRLFSRTSDDITHVKGCNMSFWKKDFVKVNGYDNNFTGWGHEDIDLAIRLYNSGVKMKFVRFRAIAFHLYHSINSRKNERLNFKKAVRSREQKTRWTENGYENV